MIEVLFNVIRALIASAVEGCYAEGLEVADGLVKRLN